MMRGSDELIRPETSGRLAGGKRAISDRRRWIGFIGGLLVMFMVFLAACWLAGNPFAATWRSSFSSYNQAQGLVGTNSWHIIWYVVLLGLVFEFTDVSAGMGYGTVMSPVLMILGFTPLQVVPSLMIVQAVCGLVATFLYQTSQSLRWRVKPIPEAARLLVMVTGLGCAAVFLSMTGVYVYFEWKTVWIELYVMLVLLVMGLMVFFQLKFQGSSRPYRLPRMAVFAFLAGFNKGIGGGGYSPLVTLGGMVSGIPGKARLAITARAGALVSTFSAAVWLTLLSRGMRLDFILLPSMMIAAIGSGILAPYGIRMFPQKFSNWVIPVYCLVCTGICFWKIGPQVIRAIGM